MATPISLQMLGIGEYILFTAISHSEVYSIHHRSAEENVKKNLENVTPKGTGQTEKDCMT